MSVPLDRLYNFLDDVSGHNLLIYRWYPHGSKKLEDLTPLKHYYTNKEKIYVLTNPIMICHDQEPLGLDQMSDEILNNRINRWKTSLNTNADPPAAIIDFIKTQLNLRTALDCDINVYDYIILLHSEVGGNQLSQCQDWAVPVYYWSHALIAKDWFRYAQDDPLLCFSKNYTHDFLIYNRAWTGTREYRLKFAELIIQSQLHNNCKMGFSITDNENDYRDHKFKNQDLSISSRNLQDYFFNNTTPSSSSADYNNEDYQTCGIEVVLETLFDDVRIHLTEKILRPIACGHPFILVSTPGALKYLHRYGFKTFHNLIDESYDEIQDPVERLRAVTTLMRDISNMAPDDKKVLFQKMSEIAKQNQKRFFSKDFQSQVVQEFKSNLDQGMEKMYQHRTGRRFREKIKFAFSIGRRLWPWIISRQECATIWKWLKRHN